MTDDRERSLRNLRGLSTNELLHLCYKHWTDPLIDEVKMRGFTFLVAEVLTVSIWELGRRGYTLQDIGDGVRLIQNSMGE